MSKHQYGGRGKRNDPAYAIGWVMILRGLGRIPAFDELDKITEEQYQLVKASFIERGVIDRRGSLLDKEPLARYLQDPRILTYEPISTFRADLTGDPPKDHRTRYTNGEMTEQAVAVLLDEMQILGAIDNEEMPRLLRVMRIS